MEEDGISQMNTKAKILNDAKVDVDIDPNVKSNDVKVQFCSFSLILNCFCFSPREKKEEG